MKYKIVPYINSDKMYERIEELGKKITEDYKGKKLKVIGILKGAAPFMCSLIKFIDNDELTIDFMSVSSYDNGTVSTGMVRINKDLDGPIEGEDVLVVEDIIDSGNTLYNLKAMLSTRNPNSIKLCTLLDKPSRRVVDIKPDYSCLTIEDRFVVGFGLDYAQKYRQLPYLAEVVFEE